MRELFFVTIQMSRFFILIARIASYFALLVRVRLRTLRAIDKCSSAHAATAGLKLL